MKSGTTADLVRLCFFCPNAPRFDSLEACDHVLCHSLAHGVYTLWSRVLQDCYYPTSTWRCWEPICTGRVDGLYPDWSTNCQRSVRCRGGRVVSALGCPAGQLSGGHSGCRPAHEVSCPRVSEGSAPAHLAPQRPVNPPAAPAPAHPLCWDKSPSLIQDRSPASRCRQYFRCSASGQRTVELCPGNQVRNAERTHFQKDSAN